jgi:hypothetical protein
MLNNYYHDFSTALIIVCTYAMALMVRFAEREGAGLFRKKVPKIYPRMLHVTGGSLVLLFMAGIVRSFTYKWFEWVEVLGMGQIVVLIFKHVLMFAIVGYGIYVWVGLHKRIKAIRSEGKEGS